MIDGLPFIDRFYSKIKFNVDTWCWDWKGTMFSSGYGAFKIKGKTWRAHRLSYTIFVGEIPSKYEIHHKCENRKCCNPEHLQLLKHIEHVKKSKNHNINKTHCIRGHPLSHENLIVKSNGKRTCRRCLNEAQRKWRKKHPEKTKEYCYRWRDKYPEKYRKTMRDHYWKKKTN